MLLNDNIVDIKTSDGVCSPNFVVDTFSGLFLHPSIFSIQDLPEKQMVLYQIFVIDDTLLF